MPIAELRLLILELTKRHLFLSPIKNQQSTIVNPPEPATPQNLIYPPDPENSLPDQGIPNQSPFRSSPDITPGDDTNTAVILKK